MGETLTQMENYLSYLYLLTPLHTGASSNEGNLMGIAREVHTEFPYLPSSSLRGKIRSALEKQPNLKDMASTFFGQKIEGGLQPTEGEVWFSDATLLFFPIASLSHHLIWITCPLWLERWNRWSNAGNEVRSLIVKCREYLTTTSPEKSAVISFPPDKLYLQTALLEPSDLVMENFEPLKTALSSLTEQVGLVTQLFKKLVVLTDEDCLALVETGLQREVRVALEENTKTVKGGSFRSEEAIPPETILFFPWGIKPAKAFQVDPKESDVQKAEVAKKKKLDGDVEIRKQIKATLNNQRLQFGGLEGLGRGWAEISTDEINGGSNS